MTGHLDSYGNLWGLVVGPWGDGSKDLYSLIKILGESAVTARSMARGWEGGEGELGLILGQTRRRLSCTFVRAKALCLLARLVQLCPGARMAADRRKEARRVETDRRREAQVHWLAPVRGRGLGSWNDFCPISFIKLFYLQVSQFLSSFAA